MAKQPRTLAGRVVAITGAARGIGRATAAALVREGATVAIGDLDLDAGRADRGGDRPARRRVRARRDRPRVVRARSSTRVEEPLRRRRRAREQRRDHAARAVRRRGRRHRPAHDRHQRARRDARDEARAAALRRARRGPPDQHRVGRRQGPVPGRRHLLRHEALRRRRDRDRPRRAARDGRRPVRRHAGRGRHRARQRTRHGPRNPEGPARRRRRGDRRDAPPAALRRLRAALDRARSPR